MNEFDPIQDYQEEVPRSFMSRIKEFLSDTRHFPTLFEEKIKNISFCSIKLWGIGILFIIIYFIWSSSGFAAVYYSWKIGSSMSSIESTESWIKSRSADLQKEKIYLSCLQDQMLRIVHGKDVEIFYCDKK